MSPQGSASRKKAVSSGVSVVPAQPVVPPHVLSAFPLLEEDY